MPSERSTVQPPINSHGLDREALHHAYRTLVMMRLLHDKATNLQRQGRIHSWLGCYGQEAAIIGSGMAMAKDDWIFPSYREHAVALVRGIPVRKLFDHLFANSLDNAKGRNLPPEYTFREINYVSISAPVGTQIPQAVGVAYAAKLRNDPVAVITYFGDGTSSTADAHVAMNFAGVWKAPVVFFCQNNGWAISIPTSKQTAAATIASRAAGYGFEGERIDGNDFLAVYGATKAAADKARSGGGPTLIEAMTYRVGPHSTSDDPSAYRDDAEVAPWRERDPIAIFERQLAELGYWDEAFAASVREEANQEMQLAAREAAEVAPPALDTIFEEVYAEMPWHIREQQLEHKRVRASQEFSSDH
jgi:pyruvate dehydrogenase E1 component alpha subunit